VDNSTRGQSEDLLSRTREGVTKVLDRIKAGSLYRETANIHSSPLSALAVGIILRNGINRASRGSTFKIWTSRLSDGKSGGDILVGCYKSSICAMDPLRFRFRVPFSVNVRHYVSRVFSCSMEAYFDMGRR
jgi:hypothetical protein